MTDRQVLVDELVRDEGIRLVVYLDPIGIPTIGVGRNLRDRGISRAEAFMLLDHDLDECITDLAGFPWFVGLDSVRQRAIVNMRFNLGPARFRGFRRMLTALAAGDYVTASHEMLASDWATQVGRRADRLARMMLTGQVDAR